MYPPLPNGKCHLKFPFWFSGYLPYQRFERLSSRNLSSLENKLAAISGQSCCQLWQLLYELWKSLAAVTSCQQLWQLLLALTAYMSPDFFIVDRAADLWCWVPSAHMSPTRWSNPSPPGAASPPCNCLHDDHLGVGNGDLHVISA